MLFEGALTRRSRARRARRAGYAVRWLPGPGPAAGPAHHDRHRRADGRDRRCPARDGGGAVNPDRASSASRSSASACSAARSGWRCASTCPGAARPAMTPTPPCASAPPNASSPTRSAIRRRCRAGADLVILCVPVGAMGEVAREIAPALPGDAGQRCRLVQAVDRRGARQGAARPRDHSGAPGRRDRAFRPRRRFRQPVPTPLVHRHAAGRRRSGAGLTGWSPSGKRSARRSR